MGRIEMKKIAVCIMIIFFPGFLCADVLILKDGSEITTNYHWKKDRNTIGYFQDGTTKYIESSRIDWEAMNSHRKTTSAPNKSATKAVRKSKASHNGAPHHAKFTGNGDDVINLSKPQKDGPAILLISANRSERHFSIKGFSSSGKRTGLLVNTAKEYDGTVLVDILARENTSQLEIKAVGAWVIYVYDIKYARKYKTPGDIEGDGDDVIIVLGSAKIMEVNGNADSRHFSIKGYSKKGRHLLVNAAQPYSGKARVPINTFLLEINAKGRWRLDTK